MITSTTGIGGVGTVGVGNVIVPMDASLSFADALAAMKLNNLNNQAAAAAAAAAAAEKEINNSNSGNKSMFFYNHEVHLLFVLFVVRLLVGLFVAYSLS